MRSAFAAPVVWWLLTAVGSAQSLTGAARGRGLADPSLGHAGPPLRVTEQPAPQQRDSGRIAGEHRVQPWRNFSRDVVTTELTLARVEQFGRVEVAVLRHLIANPDVARRIYTHEFTADTDVVFERACAAEPLVLDVLKATGMSLHDYITTKFALFVAGLGVAGILDEPVRQNPAVAENIALLKVNRTAVDGATVEARLLQHQVDVLLGRRLEPVAPPGQSLVDAAEHAENQRHASHDTIARDNHDLPGGSRLDLALRNVQLFEPMLWHYDEAYSMLLRLRRSEGALDSRLLQHERMAADPLALIDVYAAEPAVADIVSQFQMTAREFVLIGAALRRGVVDAQQPPDWLTERHWTRESNRSFVMMHQMLKPWMDKWARLEADVDSARRERLASR